MWFSSEHRGDWGKRKWRDPVLCQNKLLKWLYLYLAITAFHSWSERWRKFSTICWFIFSGIQFAKFQQFASAINLKFIGADCYYTLREKYVFPVIDSYWQTEQNRVFNSLKDRGEQVTLAGDGRCDSPGHSAKYGTYTMLDVKSNKIVDFKFLSVCEVKNSNAMEK